MLLASHLITLQNIVGVLFAKDLILVDPDDSIEIGTVLSFRGRHVAHCSQEAPLDEVLRCAIPLFPYSLTD